ncbi:Metalloprotease [Daldinia caldariorum]|uniref:Metalloprotease n=1 Tax=Daldinia caldariorum TaxID=326644 RepID=UPI002007D060|nr:Metalloprotease [Daldinia caldariorum]KAI1470124.1 Metalloprotease [Daldinia caldariorum]
MSYANTSVCLSQACIQASGAIYSHLSTDFQSLDPCTDFPTLVCGGLRERNVIPVGEVVLSEQSMMKETNRILMKNILETSSDTSWISPGSVDEENFNKLVTSYNTCLNETAIDEAGVQPLVLFLGNITESFPVELGEHTNTSRFDTADHEAFSQTYLFLAQHSIFPFLTIDVALDPDNIETYIPVVSPSDDFLPSKVYENEKTRSLYEKAVAKVLGNVLPTEDLKAKAGEMAQGVVRLERLIAANPPISNDETGTIPVTTLDNATQVAPEFDFESVFKAISPSSIDRISYNYPEYSVWLSETLAKTSNLAIQAYFIWQAIIHYEPDVNGSELEPLKRLTDAINGKQSYTPERWRTCITQTESKMGWLLSKTYVEAKYTDAVKKTLEEMTTRIQNRLASNIDHIEWMTDEVKAIAKHKVQAITPKLSYPTQSPNLDDAQSLKDYYATFEVSDSHFGNSVSYSKWKAQRTASLFGTKREKGAWPPSSGSSLTINAFYYPEENAIIINAGTLQQLLLDPELPAYMNYGSLGMVLGHEFTHSLDSSGRMYDEQGVFSDWWDDKSETEFNKRAECLIEQYDSSNLTFSDGRQVSVNGTLTLGENIADAGGINTAYDAWLDKKDEDPESDFDMPGLSSHFTREQLFYVSAAQFFCDKAGDNVKNIYLTDVHSPPEVRIKNMMENSDGFRKAFNCPVKEPTCVIY